MTIMMVALAVLFMLFLFSCLRMTNLTGGEGTRQSKGIARQPDGPDEEDLKLYFRYRDEGHPADPLQTQAEDEYQLELQRREEKKAHDDYERWKAEREKPVTIDVGEHCPIYAVVTLSDKYGKYSWTIYDRNGNVVEESSPCHDATISKTEAGITARDRINSIWWQMENRKKEETP